MKKIMLLFAVLTGLITACQNKTAEKEIDSLAASPDTGVVKTQQCYAYIKNKDTVSLSFIVAGDAVAGDLNYNLFEKDKNAGTIAGLIKGDTIIADYTFNSEGTPSKRQVVFLKKGDQLLEGYGPVKEKDGSMIFTNIAGLKFGSIALSTVTCK